MEGGEVKWKDPNECPILPLGVARTIFRDIVLGLEYRMWFLICLLLIYVFYVLAVKHPEVAFS